MRFNKIPGWCAGVKVSGFGNNNLPKSLTDLFEAHKKRRRTQSVICITTNNMEDKLIKWLKDNGFTPSPVFQNYNHAKRGTQMWFIQVPDKYIAYW